MCVPFPAVTHESLYYQIFSSHFLVEVSSFWWSKSSWSLWRGIFFFMTNWRKKWWWCLGDMVGVACFWDLYLVVELCRRLVTFSAASAPCRKGSAVVLCLSCFSLQQFPSCAGMKPLGNAACVLSVIEEFHRHTWLAWSQRVELCCQALPGASLVQFYSWRLPLTGRIQSGIRPAQVYIQTGLASLVTITCSKKLSMSGTCRENCQRLLL